MAQALKTVTVNINDKVQVKLTDFGREVHRQDHEFYCADMGIPYPALEVDADGFSSFHHWELMQIFGRHLFNGATDLPFETEIRIEVPA